jgi:hypothetical protein
MYLDAILCYFDVVGYTFLQSAGNNLQESMVSQPYKVQNLK